MSRTEGDRRRELWAAVPAPLERVVDELWFERPGVVAMRLKVLAAGELTATVDGDGDEALRGAIRMALVKLEETPGDLPFAGEAQLIADIARPRWDAWEMLPTARRLADEWRLPTTTVERALDRLAELGVVVVSEGRGRRHVAGDSSEEIPELTAVGLTIHRLRRRIASGELRTGRVLVTGTELARELGTVNATLMEALRRLCDAGEIVRGADGLYVGTTESEPGRVIDGDALRAFTPPHDAWNVLRIEVHDDELRLITQAPAAVTSARFGAPLPPGAVRLETVLDTGQRRGHVVRTVESVARITGMPDAEMIKDLVRAALDRVATRWPTALIGRWLIASCAAGELRRGSVIAPRVPAAALGRSSETARRAFETLATFGLLTRYDDGRFAVTDRAFAIACP